MTGRHTQLFAIETDRSRSYDSAGYLMGIESLRYLEDRVRVDDLIRKTVVFVGDANNKPFVPHGTGFIVVTEVEGKAFQSVVTAKHVIDGLGPFIHLRLNRRDGSAEVIPLTVERWVSHPDTRVDLAFCPTVIPKDQFDIMHVPIEEVPASRFGLGDEVLIPGMFVQRMGEARNLPIIRTGTIAALPEEKIQTQYGAHEAYLIEIRSIDGLSGSPVFAVTSLMQITDRKIGAPANLEFQFIGVLLGHDEVMNPKDRVAILPNGKALDEGVRTFLNTGIGIVAPVSLVIETVKQPSAEAARAAAARKLTASGRFVADSDGTA